MKLARRAGVSPSYISLFEHGEKIPSERVAVRIARALGDREDLYRAWAATARMDEQTRKAVVMLGAGSSETNGALPIPFLDPTGAGDGADHDLRLDGTLLGRESADGLVAMRVEASHCAHAPRGIGPGDVVVIDRSRRRLTDGVLLALKVGADVRIVRAHEEDGRFALPGTGEAAARPFRDHTAEGDDVVLGTIVWSARSW